ncbi:hypothetical protein [Tumebacillus flagellatus]|uniref:Uncharacterized protein n=1 Tax=Tumebacillus flagellatus TaxID=1157490 RepID=A0A074MGE8_9BACL|nr:hypothetical protein [Tumebacillus flagellatus]KEO84787.1 hypothetical protein EL26_01895 [Tumebacillus flagellatus]
MPVEIKITGGDAAEAVRELAALSTAMNGQAVAAPTATPQDEKPPRTRNTGKPKPDQQPPADPTPTETPKSDPPPNEDPKSSGNESGGDQGDEEKIPTVVELRALAVSKDKAKVKALLDEFECPSLSNIPEGKRANFKTRLEAL